MNTYIASIVTGAIFILVGVLGFVPNPLLAPDGLFAVNSAHNMFHVITGAIFLLGAYRCADQADILFKAIGSAYVAVTILGFLTSGNMLLGVIHINQADKWLHLALALGILGLGYVLPNRRPAVSH